jgi:hypothetical protein
VCSGHDYGTDRTCRPNRFNRRHDPTGTTDLARIPRAKGATGPTGATGATGPASTNTGVLLSSIGATTLEISRADQQNCYSLGMLLSGYVASGAGSCCHERADSFAQLGLSQVMPASMTLKSIEAYLINTAAIYTPGTIYSVSARVYRRNPSSGAPKTLNCSVIYTGFVASGIRKAYTFESDVKFNQGDCAHVTLEMTAGPPTSTNVGQFIASVSVSY